MKLLVTTRSDDSFSSVSAYTHPFIKAYANKVGADFSILSENVDGLRSHYRILRCKELFSEYDRVLVVDSDAIVMPYTPNLFELVPYEMIATVLEDKGSRQTIRRERIRQIQEKLGDVGWTEGSINTGVFLVSKCHQKIFDYKIEDLPIDDDTGVDDCYLGFQIHKYKFPIYELPFQYNAMSMWFEKGGSRWDSYIIHHAGMGHFPGMNRHEIIKQDCILVKKYYEK